jgi:tetratricopeptide (TPR) repeat protein
MSSLEHKEGNLYLFRSGGENVTLHQRETQSSAREAGALFQEGLAWEEKKDLDTAKACYQKAVGLVPGLAGGWLNLGSCHYEQRNFAEAEKCYRKAIEVDADYSRAHFNLGNLLVGRGCPISAIEHYEKALAVNPRFGDAHFNLAIEYASCGRKLEAIKHYRAFLKWGSGESFQSTARAQIRKLREELGMSRKIVLMPIAIEAVKATVDAG